MKRYKTEITPDGTAVVDTKICIDVALFYGDRSMKYAIAHAKLLNSLPEDKRP